MINFLILPIVLNFVMCLVFPSRSI